MLLRPVLKSQINGPGTQVASADTDLDYSGKFLPCPVGDLTGMYLFGELRHLLLDSHIEVPFINAVCHNSIP